MKIVRIISAAVLATTLNGCTKNSDSVTPVQSAQTEVQEENSNSGSLSLYGRILESDKNAHLLMGHKQGKIWQRVANLSASDKEKYAAYVDQINPLSIIVQQNLDGSFALHFQVGTKTVLQGDISYDAARDINVPLHSAGANILNGTSEFDGSQVVVTCAADSSVGFCNPVSGSVIEIKNSKNLLNGKPAIAAFYFSAVNTKVSADENYREDLSVLDSASFVSIANLNDTRMYARLSIANSKSLDFTLVGHKDDMGDMDLKIKSKSPDLKWFRTSSFVVSDDGKKITLGIYDGALSLGRPYYQGKFTIELPKAWSFFKP